MSEQLSVFDAPAQRPLRSLPDVGRYHHTNTRDTERAAAEAIAPALSPQRQRVLDAFTKAGSAGLTDYEGHSLARLTYPHIFATRRSELMAAGYPIADSNERRQTPSGRLAIVWKLVFKEEDKADGVLRSVRDEASQRGQG